LTLKPNLKNILRLRFRALRGQLGYKLPTLLRWRCEMPSQRLDGGALVKEALLGDDAEADAFVYSLFADICAGHVESDRLAEIMEAGDCYEDDIADAQRFASYIEPGDVVERVLIHLERQSSPADFELYGPRVVPFYNYLQAAYMLHEDGRIPAQAVLNVAQDLAVRHHFDGDSLARSYLDLARRGHVGGDTIPNLVEAYAETIRTRRIAGASELGEMVSELEHQAPEIPPPPSRKHPRLDYLRMVKEHNPRRRKRRS
jgi:hypothetical protein